MRSCHRFYHDVVGPYWPPERRITEERYQTIEFPFTEFAAPNFVIEQAVTLDNVAGYVRTWSATRAFVKRHGQDPVERLVTELERRGAIRSSHDWALAGGHAGGEDRMKTGSRMSSRAS